MERITSRQNPLMAHIRKLNASRSCRREWGEYVCDGPKLLEEALRWGSDITTVVCGGNWKPPAKLPEEIRSVWVPEDLLAAVSTTQTPQGVLFLCRMPELTLPERLPRGRYLVLDGLQDPGNAGTVWRTADAFGADGVIFLPGSADPYAPKTVRASMGACFRLPVWEASLEALCACLRRSGLPLYATALRADTEDVRQMDLAGCGVVIGSEGRGIRAETLSACGRTLKIPMRARCESLNAAVAAAIVLWEGWRSAPEG